MRLPDIPSTDSISSLQYLDEHSLVACTKTRGSLWIFDTREKSSCAKEYQTAHGDQAEFWTCTLSSLPQNISDDTFITSTNSTVSRQLIGLASNTGEIRIYDVSDLTRPMLATHMGVGKSMLRSGEAPVHIQFCASDPTITSVSGGCLALL